MSAMKNALDEILNCQECYGTGIVNGWVSPDGDYDFDWCDCNPHHLSVEDNAFEMNDVCIGCNENKVSWDALYCMTCYLANNAEIDYTEIEALFTTQEAK